MIQSHYTSNKNSIRVKYGIEQFFVPEGAGHIIESGQNRDKIAVEVSVIKSGLGLIKQVYIDNKPVDFKPQR